MLAAPVVISFFFFNDTATTEIYTLSLHDALPIFHDAVTPGEPRGSHRAARPGESQCHALEAVGRPDGVDRKSTRLNSSHSQISYAVFCLKKKSEGANPEESQSLFQATRHRYRLDA